MTNSIIQVFSLNTKDKVDVFKELVNNIDSTNPFYKVELALYGDFDEKNLNYFLYSIDGVPLITMLFFIRPIEVNFCKTPYFDVISNYGYSGPLISNHTTNSSISQFWKSVDQWYENNNIISEFIRFSLNDNKRLYSGTIAPSLKNVRGIILNEERQWEKFDKKVRNNYRKAITYNLRYEIFYENISDMVLKKFYEIYYHTMLRRNAEKQFYYSLEYFKNYADNNPKHCAIAVVYLNDKPVSTEFLLLSNDTIYSYLGGTNADFFHTRPNDFLKLSVLEWGRLMNFKYYHLGGGRIDDDQLYSYKKCFFPKDDDIIFYTGRKVIKNEIYDNLVEKSLADKSILQTVGNSLKEDFFPKYRKFN